MVSLRGHKSIKLYKLKIIEDELSIKEAEYIVGTLSKPSKMPGYSYGIPAKECIVGARLRDITNSVCNGCYALKGFYSFPVVQSAQYNRFDSLDNPAWVDAMVTLISNKTNPEDPYFRWHDSGDLQSIEHLQKIIEVCERTNWINHWLPTREYKIVRDWASQGGIVPDNLTIRLSAHIIDGPLPTPRNNVLISSVSTSDNIYSDAAQCPARHQNNECGDCRSCWDRKVFHVSYHKH